MNMLTMLAFGTFGFWAWAAIIAIWCLIAVANEWPGRATVGLIVFVAAVHFLGGGGGYLGWALHNPITILELSAAYFVVGAIWSVCRWYFFVRRLALAYRDARIRFLEDAGLSDVTETTPVPENLRSDWSHRPLYYKDRSYMPSDLQSIKLRYHKARILIWIGYWPFSMLWVMLDDLLHAIVTEVYERLQVVFRAIADRVMGKLNIAADLRVPPDVKSKL